MLGSRILLVAFAMLIAAPATAQDPNEDPRTMLYIFDVEADETYAEITDTLFVDFPITFHDRSRDSSGGLAPQAPGGNVQSHQTTWDVVYANGTDRRGYQVDPPSSLNTFGGQSREEVVRVSILDTQITESMLAFEIVATTRAPGFVMENRVQFAVLAFGPDNFNALSGGSVIMAPGETSAGTVRITNGNLLPRTFVMEVADNTCGLTEAHPSTVVVPPKSTVEASISIRGPTDRPYYSSEICSIRFTVFPADASQNTRAVPLSIQVQGVYVNPVWVFWTLAAAVAIFVFVVFVRRRKQVIEEELLGKPQRPWTIPVERVYLEHLESADPRAAYIVRNFLMEEEYQSALLWYKNYKAATRGARQKEALVVRQEQKYDRFKRGWEKQINAPMKQADKFETKLQKKLDRQAKKRVRKERRAWKKLVAKLEQAVESQNAKALAKWEKSAAKAEKKGNPVPPKPELATPDLPPEPQLEKILLADHKWDKKAQKFRKKMVKRQGDLEVKFEKKDARMLHKLRKKVHKIARKLDDPEFVNEHPLLAGEA